MKLVEVIRGPKTEDSVIDALLALSKRIGKAAVRAPDKPGFIVNRLLIPYKRKLALHVPANPQSRPRACSSAATPPSRILTLR